MKVLEEIDNHSVRTDLLSSGNVLDAGARGFRFAKALQALGCQVIALDPDPDVVDPQLRNIGLLRRALVNRKSHEDGVYLIKMLDPEAHYVSTVQGPYPVHSCTIQDLLKFSGIEQFDLVKLNIEGAEYDILAEWPGPIARQISVSFHEHTTAKRGVEKINEIVDHLAQWYTPVRHVWEERYCAGFNFWSSLFVLKELA